MNPEFIAVFNICGINKKPNLEHYVRNIRNLLAQKDVDLELVLSACQNSPEDIAVLQREFGTRLSYFTTNQNLTVNITFNKACALAARAFGMPAAFLYVDSGCDVGSDPHVLQRLFANHKSGDWGMTASLVDNDVGFDLWRPGMTEDQLFKGDLYHIPVGQTCNLHFQMFDRSIVEAFGHPIPDVFRDFCTESIFSFMCAAVGRSFGLWRNARVAHAHGMDGGCAAFVGERGWRNLLPEAPRKIEEIIADPEARACGFGYEECENILMHDPALYDGNGMVKDPERLKRFIAQTMFLPQQNFNYDHIAHGWRPSQNPP